MKPKILLVFLRVLIYLKRALWWLAGRAYFVLSWIFGPFFRFFSYFRYKTGYLVKKTGINDEGSWLKKREFLQLVLFAALFIIAIPQTHATSQKSNLLAGQKTIAFTLSGDAEQFGLEEIQVSDNAPATRVVNRFGEVLNGSQYVGSGIYGSAEWDLAAVSAGGTAFTKPMVLPGAMMGGSRTHSVDYIVEPGDSLSSIAYQYSVSVATIMWQNKLSLRSILRPGDKLSIPPTTGLMHKVKKGDSLKKIAGLYDAKVEEIIKFNKLKDDGSDLVAGEEIMIPNGVKPEERVFARAPAVAQTISSIAKPPSSRQVPGLAGFVWPSAAKLITQYFGLRHHALDIAGAPKGTPIYAAKGGKVVISQCGWNGGYGCYVVVDHGGGLKTVYGHNSRLLVSVGEYVETGQTIALMGNSGNVRGITGIHLHFELRVNNVCVNPLSYVR